MTTESVVLEVLNGEVRMPSIDDEFKKMETMLIMTPIDDFKY